MQKNTDQTQTFKPSANQQFKNFLEETGQANLPKSQRDSLFKTWLQKAVEAGSLQNAIDNVKDKINQGGTGNTTSPAPTDAKPFRPLGMHPVAAGAVVIIVTTIAVYGIVQCVKYLKKQ